jgi:hypothetical protein
MHDTDALFDVTRMASKILVSLVTAAIVRAFFEPE